MNSEDVQSRLMTRALRKIQHTLSRSETLIIFVNQVWDDCFFCTNQDGILQYRLVLMLPNLFRASDC
jgi:hypothetical protein